jgi:hypothetical protein
MRMTNMQISKKQALTAIALILMLTLTTFLAGIQFTSAKVTDWDTFGRIMVAPNPAGLNQQVVVTAGIDKPNPLSTSVAGGERWRGIRVNITRPDGVVEQKGPYEAFAMANTYFYYVPTMEGNYTFQSSFPGQWANVSAADQRWYKPTMSEKLTLTVKKEPVEGLPGVPLPSGYWTRPIYGENKGWNTIADNWLMPGYDYTLRTFTIASTFAPYTSAPNSPHVLWKKQIIFGGIVGGKYGDDTYYTGLSYEQHYTPLIVSGRIIFTEHFPTSSAATSRFGTRSIDLFTGKDVWFLEGVDIAFAQVLQFDSPNEHGAIAHLWSTSGSGSNNTWKMYDAFTGRYILSITNITVSSATRRGTINFGPNGELLAYSIGGRPGNNSWLSMWNSTKALVNPIAGVDEYYSPVNGSVVDGRRGIEWNVTLPASAARQNILQVNGGYILMDFWDTTTYPNIHMQSAYPSILKKDATTKQYPTSINAMWLQNITGIDMPSPKKFSNINEGVYVMYDEGKMQYHGFSILTGERLWVTEPLTSGWAQFSGYATYIAYGKLFTAGYDGYVRAFNIKDGSLIWASYYGTAGYETAYGTWPTYEGVFIADGKLYVTNDDHSPDAVIWRGGKLRVYDVENGASLWNVSGWFRHPSMADGLLTGLNSLDGQVYTFGKGPSKTTVATSPEIVTKGATVMVKGTVTDQSPAQEGSPAISDASMSAWMEALHMQKPTPSNATGVMVKLTAVDSSGTTHNIGSATSDMYGTYGIMWTPPATGQYQILATFEGTQSYGGSAATTYLGVVDAPAPSAPSPTATPTAPTPTSTPATSPSPSPATPPAQGLNTSVYVAIAAVVVIAAVAAVAIFLKKRK